jgi:protein phosphatase
MEPALDLPAAEYAERSDPGRDPSKQVNEDSCGHLETRFGHLCVVCDGMGGHASGREAAELALNTIFSIFETAPETAAPAAVLRAAIEEANRQVFAMTSDELAPGGQGLGRPGSTVVAVLMHARGTEVGHVGDSRAYLIHEGQIYRVTRDHSIVQEMVDRGLLTPQQAATHPDANRITRALGVAPEVEAEVRSQPVLHVTGDAFVLCSDGLSDLVEDPEILGIVEGIPAAQAAGKLVDLANARGGHDNVTAVILRARSSAFTVGVSSVAPTVAQTNITQAHGGTAIPEAAALPRAPVAERATEVPLPTGPLEPTIPPPARRGAWPWPPGRMALVGAVVLAVLAAGLLAVALASHLADRSGTHNTPSDSAGALVPLSAALDAGASGQRDPPGQGQEQGPGRGRAEPTTLVPESPPPTGAAPNAPIAPLETATATASALEPLPHGRKRK